MSNWVAGNSRAELEAAQERYGVHFPPDLLDVLIDRRPSDGYDWAGEDSDRIREMLVWPLDMLVSGVERGCWFEGWGERPPETLARREIVRDAVAGAPRLIPLIGHRFIPETPNEAGNPVFSMHGFDTVYYGANLAEYFANEFGGKYEVGPTRHIPLWSDLAEQSFTWDP
jgi:hypothetical protein